MCHAFILQLDIDTSQSHVLSEVGVQLYVQRFAHTNPAVLLRVCPSHVAEVCAAAS